MAARSRGTLRSSSCCTPKPVSGRSLQPLPVVLRQTPLFTAQSMIARLLSSKCCGFLARNWSTQSKQPSSGKATGTTTSCLPLPGEAAAAISQSAVAASCTMRQRNGSVRRGGSAKFSRSAVPRKLTAGKSALPRRPSGRGCGSATRTPPRKRLTLLAFGLPASRFSSTATAWSAPNFCDTRFFTFPCRKKPSESKHTLSSPSARSSEPPAAAKPRRTVCCGPRCWPCCGPTGRSPRTTASNM
mmetsp:Transcript_128227/g.356873  ORF Transcript_128227/g.356873 Transcript_128227/m.356873 type:complete len:243 (+) Transcript_128227:1130-1858(+)